jgi:hypothetical protein
MIQINVLTDQIKEASNLFQNSLGFKRGATKFKEGIKDVISIEYYPPDSNDFRVVLFNEKNCEELLNDICSLSFTVHLKSKKDFYQLLHAARKSDRDIMKASKEFSFFINEDPDGKDSMVTLLLNK